MRFLVLLLLSEDEREQVAQKRHDEAKASATDAHKRQYGEIQKRHDEATASAKDAQKRQYDEVKADHNRWNQLAWEEHREFRGEYRMAFSRLENQLENMFSRLENMILVVILVLILVVILVVGFSVHAFWLYPLHSMVRTISADIDPSSRGRLHNGLRHGQVESSGRSGSGRASPSIDEALALVPDRFAVVKQRARRWALENE